MAEGQTGHYWNMISDKTTHVACGFGFNDENQVVMTQQFWGGGDQLVDGEWVLPCEDTCSDNNVGEAEECYPCYGKVYPTPSPGLVPSPPTPTPPTPTPPTPTPPTATAAPTIPPMSRPTGEPATTSPVQVPLPPTTMSPLTTPPTPAPSYISSFSSTPLLRSCRLR